MEEHGFYIWTAYTLAALVGLWVVAWPVYRRRKFFSSQGALLKDQKQDDHASG